MAGGALANFIGNARLCGAGAGSSAFSTKIPQKIEFRAQCARG